MSFEEKAFNALQQIKLATRALDITQDQAIKLSRTPKQEIKIVDKITFKNFYKKPRFWTAIGAAVGLAATGDYIHALTAIGGLFGLGL